MKKWQKGKGTFAGIGIGLCVSMLTGALLSAILAWAIVREYSDDSAYMIFAIQLLSAGAGAWAAASFTEEKKIIACTTETAVYLLTLAGITLLVFHGHYARVIQGTIAAASGAILPFFLCRKGKKGGRRIMNYRVYR